MVMTNIQQFFRVQIMLGQSEREDFETFYNNFSKDSQYSSARHEFYIEYQGNEWWVDTFSDHLCCVTEFDSIEAAQKAEYDGFEILSLYGYWKEEE